METPFIWEPPREFIECTNVYRFMQRLGIATCQDFSRYSQEHLEEFWGEMVRELAIEWFEPYQQVLDASRGVEWARWFTGGKLNIAWNCLDRHANGPAVERATRPRSRAGRPRGSLYAYGPGSGHDSLRLLQTGPHRCADILRFRLWRGSRAPARFGRQSAVHSRFYGAPRAADRAEAEGR